jgi:hypothetical protein
MMKAVRTASSTVVLIWLLMVILSFRNIHEGNSLRIIFKIFI